MILSSVTVFSVKPQHTLVEDEALLTQLKADLFYAQSYAMSHQQEVSVVILPNESKYSLVLRSDQPHLLDRSYSSSFHIIEGSMPLYFKFQPDGNVNKFGSFFIETEKKTYRMTILIGKGRFYVTEQ
nr:competence type IV pilus minor pilin ComGD [Neobacillus sp. 114]